MNCQLCYEIFEIGQNHIYTTNDLHICETLCYGHNVIGRYFMSFEFIPLDKTGLRDNRVSGVTLLRYVLSGNKRADSRVYHFK